MSSARHIAIPADLLDLKPSESLESVSMSTLARKGTSLLRQLTDNAQAVTVKVQGQGAMVTVSQRQYDEMVALIHRLQQDDSADDFTRELGRRFDELVGGMNAPAAAGATDRALFGDTEALNESYRPGATEAKD